MKKFKRDLFFWLERLQITRKERLVISFLLVLVVLMISFSAVLKHTYNSNTKNYDEILKRFEEKSALIKREENSSDEKYIGKEKKSPIPDTAQALHLININTADIAELQTLKGIGKTYAQRIVDYRVENGEFKDVEELLKVKGIGKKRLEDIKAFVTLK